MKTKERFAVIGKDGWRDPRDLPDTDRKVQLAWDDMSYGDSSIGFCDSKSGENQRIWWSLKPNMLPLGFDQVGAWRDFHENR